MLNELQSRGKILPNARVVKYEGILGEPFCRYLDYKKSNRMSSGRMRATTLYLHEFYLFLQNNGVSMVEQINRVHILNFIRHMDTFPPSVAYSTIGLLKDMFHFFYNDQILDIDYSGSIPRGRYIKQADLPSTYSAVEISSLLASVNRASPIGKRDYAIIMIAARIGLRSSDISNLQFSNLRWDNNLIVL
jgi:site-specific recombinase XerD